jgi:hypothetical protein
LKISCIFSIKTNQNEKMFYLYVYYNDGREVSEQEKGEGGRRETGEGIQRENDRGMKGDGDH